MSFSGDSVPLWGGRVRNVGVMQVFFNIFCLGIYAGIVSAAFQQNEALQLTKSLTQHFNSDLLLLITDGHLDDTIRFQKELSEDKIFSQILTMDMCLQMLRNPALVHGLSPYRKPMVILTHSRAAEEVLHNVSSGVLLAPLAWVMFVQDSILLPVSFYIPLNCIFLVVQPSSVLPDVVIYSQYTPDPNTSSPQSWVNEVFGRWTRSAGLSIDKDIDVTQRNLQGSVLTLAFQYKFHNCSKMTKVIDSAECIHLKLWQLLEGVANFTTGSIINTLPGKIYPNGTITGSFEFVQSHELDASAENYAVSSQRLDMFDFVWPTYIGSSRFFQKREHQRLSWNGYLQPFAEGVWWTLVAWTTLFGCTLFCTFSLMAREQNKKKASVKHQYFGITEAIMIPYRSLCYQSGSTASTHWSFRSAYITAYLTGVIMYPAYSAAVIAYITVKRPVVPFTSVQELIEDNTYQLIMVRDGLELFYFLKDDSLESRTLRHRFIPPHNELPETELDGVQQMCAEDKKVFLCYERDVDMVEKLPCDIVRSNRPEFVFITGMLLAKDTPYTRLLNKSLRRLRYNGLLEKLNRNPVATQLNQDEGRKQFSSVEFNSVLPLLMVYSAALLLATSIAVLEHQVHHTCNTGKHERPTKTKHLPTYLTFPQSVLI